MIYRDVGACDIMNFGVKYDITIYHGDDDNFYIGHKITDGWRYYVLSEIMDKNNRYINWEHSTISDEDQKLIISYLVMEAL